MRYLFMLILLVLAVPAAAYEILLDIDTDDDPSTINEITYETSATVRIVLVPTEAEEEITYISVGLGGSCLECNGVQEYGTSFEVPFDSDWTEIGDLVGQAGGSLYLGCAGDPGYHIILEAEATGEFFLLDKPTFIGTVEVSVAPPVPEHCYQPASNLAAMLTSGDSEYWNYIQLGGSAISTTETTWSCLKACYR